MGHGHRRKAGHQCLVSSRYFLGRWKAVPTRRGTLDPPALSDWAGRRIATVYTPYMTDAYAQPDESIPLSSELGECVKQYRITVRGGELRHQHVRSFGATSGQGRLKTVDSLWVNPGNERLLIAEETEGEVQIKIYTLDGTFTGETIPSRYFQTETEGIMLYECVGGGGYWLMTDQSEQSNTFHVFDRESLAYAGSLQGDVVSNTDGSTVAVDRTDIAEGVGLSNCQGS